MTDGVLPSQERYRASCQKDFWQKVFREEAAYLEEHLQGYPEILSVGCGPASVEAALIRAGFTITGLDVSSEALQGAPDSLRAVVGRAEALPFADRAFDAVIFIVSLQFVEDCRQAVDEAARVLKPGGRMIAMLLNPESVFYKEKRLDSDSYVNQIKQVDVQKISDAMATRFKTSMNFFLGVQNGCVTTSQDPSQAALVILTGDKEKTGDLL